MASCTRKYFSPSSGLLLLHEATTAAHLVQHERRLIISKDNASRRGRPRKDTSKKLRRRFNVGFSDDEMQMIEEEMDVLGVYSVQDYIRDCVLKKHPFVPCVNHEQWATLARPLANLNQIARRLNSGGRPEVDDVMKHISQAKSVLSEVRNQLIGVAADDNEENDW